MPPPADLVAALERLEVEGFALGAAWTAAHELAQAHEGEGAYDRLHALLHRIEGDAWNAGYWYRRAGLSPCAGPFAEEANALRRSAR